MQHSVLGVFCSLCLVPCLLHCTVTYNFQGRAKQYDVAQRVPARCPSPVVWKRLSQSGQQLVQLVPVSRLWVVWLVHRHLRATVRVKHQGKPSRPSVLFASVTRVVVVFCFVFPCFDARSGGGIGCVRRLPALLRGWILTPDPYSKAAWRLLRTLS